MSGKPPDASLPREGFVLLILLSVLWGLNFPLVKIALAEIGPWSLRSFCLVVGALGMLGLAWASRLPLRVPRAEVLPLFIVSLFNITGFHLLSAYGLSLIDSSSAIMIAYTMPLWVVLLSVPLLGEALTGRRAFGLLLGLGGVALLSAPAWGAIGQTPVGILVMISAAICWAVGTVGLKLVKWSIPTLVLSGWQLTLGAMPVVIGTPFFETIEIPDLSWQAGAALAYSAIVSTVICVYAWFRLIAVFPAGIAALSTLAIPVVGVLGGNILLAEPLTARMVMALILLLAALACVLLEPRILFRTMREALTVRKT